MEPVRTAWIAGIVVSLLAALPGLAQAQASRAELEARVAQLERLADNQGLIELARQLDALQAEVRALRGSVEELQFSLNGAKEQQRAQYLDLDQRLQAVEEGAARLAATATVAGSDPAAQYQAAFDLLKAGKYDQAKAGFEGFLASHPAHELAANAQYWLGEVSYVERDYDLALESFRKVLGNYPQARKAPDALYKLGKVQCMKGNREKAKEYLDQVISRYGSTDSSAVKLAREFNYTTC